METEPSLQVVVAKKIWNIVRTMFFMVRKGILKSRIMVDLHLMLKRGKLATKAITNLMFHSNHHHHSSSSGCRFNDALSFVSPREYEFSCSNSPAFYPFYAITNKRKHNHFGKSKSKYQYDDASTVSAVEKVLEMLNGAGSEGVEAGSPLTLPGFGRSPMVRQLRITDSPFPLKDDGDSVQVDKAAEEFIKNFYKDLKLQKNN